VHFLARTYIAEIFPLEYLHATHKSQGYLFFTLATLHAVGHIIRWGVRGELAFLYEVRSSPLIATHCHALPRIAITMPSLCHHHVTALGR